MKNHNISPQGTQAPSEKHLEDWLWEHPESLGVYDCPGYKPFNLFRFHFRQYPLPSGRPDLIGQNYGNYLLVAELKKGPVTYKALGQVLRYMWDLHSLFWDVADVYVQEQRPNHEYIANYGRAQSQINKSAVRGLLIGNGVEDSNLALACRTSGVRLMTYRYDNAANEYHFEDADNVSTPNNWRQGRGELYSLAMHIMKEHATLHRDMTLCDLFDVVKAANDYVNNIDGGVA